MDRLDEYAAAGVGELTVGVGGPDYDLSRAKALIDWRDSRR